MNEGLTSRYCLRVISQLLLPISEKTMKTLKSHVKSDKKSQETKEESLERITGEKYSIENANEQIRSLLLFKESLINSDLFSNICVTLSGPLRKLETERTEGENQIIETVLHILSNLSSIHTIGDSATTAEKMKSKELQCKLIYMFDVSII